MYSQSNQTNQTRIIFQYNAKYQISVSCNKWWWQYQTNITVDARHCMPTKTEWDQI